MVAQAATMAKNTQPVATASSNGTDGHPPFAVDPVEWARVAAVVVLDLAVLEERHRLDL